jgi:predicted transcriptional regulator
MGGKMAKLVNNVAKLVEAKQAEIERKTGKRPSQVKIAAYMDVAPSTLSAYITEKRSQIDVKVWQAMVDYFGVRGDEIFNMLPDEES